MASDLNEFKKFGRREITLGDGLVVEVQNPSLLRLVQSGKIPNPLLPVVSKLLNRQAVDLPKDENLRMREELKMNADVIEIYVMASLVSPTYEEIKDYLTDEHKLEIVAQAKVGVAEIANF